jgi:hypothetical protein
MERWATLLASARWRARGDREKELATAPSEGAQSSDESDFVTTLCDPALAHGPKWELKSRVADYYEASGYQSGSTRSWAICWPAFSSSISKMPVIVAGNENVIVLPGSTSFIRS